MAHAGAHQPAGTLSVWFSVMKEENKNDAGRAPQGRAVMITKRIQQDFLKITTINR